ncbi:MULTISPECIES: hypothetical protein [unclassified Cohnella]|uniref:hypothetical protein n=1 Tax=unclassified Cohnella TaxID=2636738 RepID=UPI0013043721|nr:MULTISPECIES: hypothetical protein [unclassified Cohnella]
MIDLLAIVALQFVVDLPANDPIYATPDNNSGNARNEQSENKTFLVKSPEPLPLVRRKPPDPAEHLITAIGLFVSFHS